MIQPENQNLSSPEPFVVATEVPAEARPAMEKATRLLFDIRDHGQIVLLPLAGYSPELEGERFAIRTEEVTSRHDGSAAGRWTVFRTGYPAMSIEMMGSPEVEEMRVTDEREHPGPHYAMYQLIDIPNEGFTRRHPDETTQVEYARLLRYATEKWEEDSAANAQKARPRFRDRLLGALAFFGRNR